MRKAPHGLQPHEPAYVEEIQVCRIDFSSVDPLQRVGIDIHLRPIAGDHCIQRLFRYIVGLEIHDGNAVGFQQRAVHNTL